MEIKLKARKLKNAAWRNLKGNWGVAILAFVIFSIISSFASAPSRAVDALLDGSEETGSEVLALLEPFILGFAIFGLVIAIVAGCVLFILGTGMYRLHLDIAEGKKADLGRLFWGFKNRPFRIIGANIMITLTVLVASAVFYVSLIVIFMCMYANPDFQTMGCILMGFMIICLFAVAFVIDCAFALVPAILAENTEIGAFGALKESVKLMKGYKWRCFCLSFSFFWWYLLAIISCGIALLWLRPYIYQSRTLFYKMRMGELDEEGNVVGPQPEVNFSAAAYAEEAPATEAVPAEVSAPETAGESETPAPSETADETETPAPSESYSDGTYSKDDSYSDGVYTPDSDK